MKLPKLPAKLLHTFDFGTVQKPFSSNSKFFKVGEVVGWGLGKSCMSMNYKGECQYDGWSVKTAGLDAKDMLSRKNFMDGGKFDSRTPMKSAISMRGSKQLKGTTIAVKFYEQKFGFDGNGKIVKPDIEEGAKFTAVAPDQGLYFGCRSASWSKCAGAAGSSPSKCEVFGSGKCFITLNESKEKKGTYKMGGCGHGAYNFELPCQDYNDDIEIPCDAKLIQAAIDNDVSIGWAWKQKLAKDGLYATANKLKGLVKKMNAKCTQQQKTMV